MSVGTSTSNQCFNDAPKKKENSIQYDRYIIQNRKKKQKKKKRI